MRKSKLPGRFTKLLAVALPIRSRGPVALSVALCTLLLGICSSASAQSFTVTTFEAPGASTVPFADSVQGTFAASINNSGVMTGFYVDAGGYPHGYLRAHDGTITTIDDVTDGCDTTPSSINNSGAITGYCGGDAFLRAPDGTFATFLLGAYQTVPSSINNVGAITGNFTDANYLLHGFLRAPGRHGYHIRWTRRHHHWRRVLRYPTPKHQHERRHRGILR